MLDNHIHFGMKISKFNKSELIQAMKCSIKENKQFVIHGYSLTMFYLLRKYKQVFSIIQQFECLTCDGRGFYYFMKLCGARGVSKYTLPEIVYIALDLANANKYRIYLLGATETNNVSAINAISGRYRDIASVDGRDGYFSVDEEEEIVKAINSALPDILYVGISTPKKEEFLSKHRNNINASVIINCGGMIDVLGGNAKLPPRIITVMGLSWLYRVVQEPKRLVTVTLKNGIMALFTIVPRTFYEYYIKKNTEFSIPKYAKIE